MKIIKLSRYKNASLELQSMPFLRQRHLFVMQFLMQLHLKNPCPPPADSLVAAVLRAISPSPTSSADKNFSGQRANCDLKEMA